MSRELLIQIACLYGSISASAILLFVIRPRKRLAIGLLYSTAWTASLLPWLDYLAQTFGLWAYSPTGFQLGEIPLALYLGWVIAWGVFAPLLSQCFGQKPWLAAATMILLDLWLMPKMSPLLTLSGHWWIGEIAISMLLLIPSIYLTEWTANSRKLSLRCAMLIPAFGGIIIGIPLLVLAGSPDVLLTKWNSHPLLDQSLYLLVAIISSLLGITALRDLALSGKGTPVPLEPPIHLIDHGIYAYIRNPMQLSMTSLLIIEAHFLWSAWPLVIAVSGLVYSEGFARWSENQDMDSRFGLKWKNYKSSHRPWFPSLLPHTENDCEIWATTPAACAEKQRTGLWLGLRLDYRSAKHLNGHTSLSNESHGHILYLGEWNRESLPLPWLFSTFISGGRLLVGGLVCRGSLTSFNFA